jgi:predicted CoA-binding protein
MSIKGLIDNFLSQKHIAMIGVSSEPNDFSRALMNEFIKHQYKIIPVNPKTTEIDGLPCYARVQEIPTEIDAALVITSKSATENAVRDCHKKGIDLIWLYRSVGSGSVSDEAVEYGKKNSLQIIPGYCPMMFFQNPGFIHKFHRVIMKITGSYPK